MDSSAPAAAPWVVLVVATLALVGLAVHALAARRGRPAAAPPPAAEEPRHAVAAVRFPHDDLPGFLDAPPGTPGAGAAGEPAAARPPAVPPAGAGDGPGPGRALAAMAAAGLLLVDALALVALAGSRDAAPAGRPGPPSAAPAPRTATAPPAPGRPPELPAVPAHPLPGETGAGALAARSVPLGEHGVAVRLSFGGLVVERHAVGVTVAYPALSATAAGDGEAALTHLRLPRWNCLAAEAPADPAAAGCVPAVAEYADLPSPALTVTREGDGLRVAGRFPTYTRPLGGTPTYTGRVYDLTVAVAPAGPVRDGEAPAEATMFLGTDRATTRDAPGLNVLRRGG